MNPEHPVFKVPSIEDAQRYAALVQRSGRVLSAQEAWKELEAKRRDRIAREKANPLLFGWEPPIWRVCDALLGLDFVIPQVFGADYGPRMRRLLLGDPNRRLRLLLLNGGNRAGKTEYMMKRALQCLLHFDRATLWCFHSDGDMSKAYHQPLHWKFFPEQFKRKSVMSKTTYISYKAKTGFSDGTGYILPNLSNCEFRNYMQEKTKIEGGELGDPARSPCLGFVADELIPEDWVETLVLRLATRSACGMVGFTPVDGYSPTVKLFQDGARVVRHSRAWLLPKQKVEPAVDAAMLTEDCDAWIEAAPPREQEGAADYELVPRVMVSKDPTRGVVFFHSSDNPYGNPREVWGLIASKHTAFKRERFYGVPDKQQTGAFPLFKPEVHVIPHGRLEEKYSTVDKEGRRKWNGTMYQIVDPCSGRNFFMLWLLATADGKTLIVDEWPNDFDAVPNIGIMGEWAVPGGGKKHDGARGPSQKGLGWSFVQYKKEIARIEGWEAYREEAGPDAVREWDQWGPKRREVFERLMDSRFAGNNLQTGDSVRTVFEEFDDIGLTFQETATGKRQEIDEGVQMINAALYYNPEQPIIPGMNEPSLLVSDRCTNMIFAMQTWTGQDGNEGATKDPCDCVRYFFLRKCGYMPPMVARAVAGRGCY